MELLYKFRHAEQKFRGIIIVAHDMTQKERTDCKNLVQDAKRMQDDDTSGGGATCIELKVTQG